jgi:hypothetical protein
MYCKHDEFLTNLQLAEEEAERTALATKDKRSMVECCICAESYAFDFIVPCLGDPTMHFLCKICFHSNATITNTRPIASIICPVPKCGTLFATQDARNSVSEWEALQLQMKQDDIDSRVALAGVAQLHCPCGTVAVIRKEDVGNGIVNCNCGKSYCVKCGNFAHARKPCPPPADTLKWLQKHAKPCPNCHNQIQKNGGCDHMTCLISAGGCGYEFWFTCGCNFKQIHICARGGGISLPPGMNVPHARR